MIKVERKILDKIKKGNIKPKPKWQFFAKNIFIWAMLILTIILGGLIAAILLFRFLNFDLPAHNIAPAPPTKQFLLSLPYLWLVLLIVSVYFAVKEYKFTKKGHKINALILIIIIITASLVLGGAFYYFGIGEKVDDSLTNKLPPYKIISQRQEFIWNNPEKGLLTGEIVKTEENNFELKSSDDKTWQVNYCQCIKDKFLVEEGNKVKIFGKIVNNMEFEAKQIRPLFPNRRPGFGSVKGEQRGPKRIVN